MIAIRRSRTSLDPIVALPKPLLACSMPTGGYDGFSKLSVAQKYNCLAKHDRKPKEGKEDRYICNHDTAYMCPQQIPGSPSAVELRSDFGNDFSQVLPCGRSTLGSGDGWRTEDANHYLRTFGNCRSTDMAGRNYKPTLMSC